MRGWGESFYFRRLIAETGEPADNKTVGSWADRRKCRMYPDAAARSVYARLDRVNIQTRQRYSYGRLTARSKASVAKVRLS